MQQDLRLQGIRALIRFFEPGACGYENDQKRYYVNPENLMNVCSSHEGVPLIIEHQDVNSSNVDKITVGYVGEVFRNNAGIKLTDNSELPADHWAWCEAIITDVNAVKLIQQGYQVSNSYTPIFANEGGYERNGSRYDAEIIGGQGLHIAIVKDPRYEGTMILLNARRIIKNSKDKKNILDNKLLNIKTSFVINANYMKEVKNILSNAKKIFSKPLKNETEKEKEVEEVKNIKNFHIKNEDGSSISGEDIQNTFSEYLSKKEKENNIEKEKKLEKEESKPALENPQTTEEAQEAKVVDISGEEIGDDEYYEVLLKLKGSDIKNMYQEMNNRSYEEIQKDEDKLETEEREIEEEGEKLETEEREEVAKMQNSKNIKKPSAIQKSLNNAIKNGESSDKEYVSYISGFDRAKSLSGLKDK